MILRCYLLITATWLASYLTNDKLINQTMNLMQEHFRILILTFSYFFFVRWGRTSVPRQIQQTLLTSDNCVNDPRKHDECHLCVIERAFMGIVN